MKIWILLFFFYLFVIVNHVYKRSETTKQSVALTLPTRGFFFTNQKACHSIKDCKPNEICFRGRCIQRLDRDRDCNPHTGEWALVDSKYAKCVCKYPSLVTQNYDGGNCIVDVACGPHGHLESFDVDPLKNGRCICKPGYRNKFDPQKGPSCVVDLHYRPNDECLENEMLLNDGKGLFTSSYLRQNKHRKCVKRPCMFDAVSGRPLKRAKFEPGFGCVCDPRYGNFGVRFNNDDYLQNVPGYNACSSIFQNEPDVPTNHVELLAYFYMLNRQPVAMIKFTHLTPDSVKSVFREYMQNETLIVGEDWPYDYMQYALKHLDYNIHTRSCKQLGSYITGEFLTMTNPVYCNEREIIPKRMIDCRAIPISSRNYTSQSVIAYHLLYQFPVCIFGTDATNIQSIYRGRYVLNPLLMTYTGSPNAFRSNGLSMIIEGGKWLVTLAESPHVRRYIEAVDPNYVPHI